MKGVAMFILILIAFLIGILIGSALEASGTNVIKFVVPLAFGIVVFFVGLCIGNKLSWE